jgi:hypothetical protein
MVRHTVGKVYNRCTEGKTHSGEYLQWRHRRNYREGNIFHGNIERKTHNGEYIYLMGIPRGGHKVGNIHNGDSEGKKEKGT